LLDEGDDPSCFFEHHLSSPGKFSPSVGTVKQPHAKAIFQLPNGAGQRRLLDMQSCRCPGEMTFFCYGDETA